MAKKFYVLSTEAEIQSGADRYRLIQGKELDEALKAKKFKGKVFMKQELKKGEVIMLEVPDSKKKEYQAEKDREKNRRKVASELDISFTSLDVIIGNEDSGSGEEIIADKSANVEESIIAHEEMELLKQALNELTEDEYNIIYSMYLAEKRKTEQALADEMHIARSKLHRRKQAILAQIKKFFDFGEQSADFTPHTIVRGQKRSYSNED